MCLYSSTHVCMCICMNADMYTCMHELYDSVCMYVCICMYVGKCASKIVCIISFTTTLDRSLACRYNTNIHAYIDACICTYIQACIHTFIHTYAHAYIRTYIIIHNTTSTYVKSLVWTCFKGSIQYYTSI